MKLTKNYKNNILPKNVLKVSIEAGVTSIWYKYVDKCIGIDSFGESGKGSEVMDYFGFSVKKIENQLLNYLVNI